MLTPLLLALAAQNAPDRTTEPQSPPIIVVGTSEADLATAVEACRRASCPVRQDVIASARYAEYLLRAGEYRKSYAVLTAATQRLNGRSAEDPAAVSQLYQALATVSDHYGDRDQQRRSTGASVRVLRQNDAPAESVLRARLTHISSQSATTAPVQTQRAFDTLIEDALEAGESGIAAEAQLLKAVIARSRGETASAIRLVDEALAQPGTGPTLARSGRILLARWAVADGRATLEQARAMVGIDGSDEEADAIILPERPQPIDPATLQVAATGIDRSTRSSDYVPIVWADVGFDIGPNGQVSNVRVLRSSSQSLGWLSETLGAIAAQRYSEHPGPQPQSRLERYTLTADIARPIGSLIARRVRNGRIARLDLTPR
jgi:hypothetical protein